MEEKLVPPPPADPKHTGRKIVIGKTHLIHSAPLPSNIYFAIIFIEAKTHASNTFYSARIL